MKGPGIVKDERIYGASILDITPTVLTLFGLPVGKDMDGKVLLNVFDEKVTPEFIDSWENVEGNFGMHPKDVLEDPWSSQEAMDQLVELGYVEAPGEDQKENLTKIKNESQYYLAITYLYKRDYSSALPILEKLFSENPGIIRYGLRLASCYQSLGKNEQCRETIYKTRETGAKELPHLDFLEGSLLLSENKPRKALEKFALAESSISHFPNLYVQLGNTYFKLKKFEDAIRSYNKALEMDPDRSVARHGLGVSLLRLERYEEAIDELLTTVGLTHFLPAAHFHLGEALLKSGNYEMAEQAFNVSIVQMPANKRAHQWLIKLYRDHLNLPEKVKEHENFIENNILGNITVVSGLPRSGTSMMMQMLQAGGLEPLTDDVRKGDVNNPKGYLEYEKVKKLHLDNSWLKEADNKVVKIVSPLLMSLPPQFNYKVVFMLRGMEEIIYSQQKMLGKSTESLKNAYPVSIVSAFTKQLEKADIWMKSQPNLRYIYVRYSDVLKNPREQAEIINSFFENELDEDKMVSAIDSSLYRNKSTELKKSE
jgi:tetratricopeptide (TPR) repeat protein